jgi:hypothetical protein
MKTRYTQFAVLLIFGISISAQAAVTASVNRNVISSGETIQLRIQRDGSADSQPDISPLKKDFDVLGSSSGSNVQIINGHMSTQMQITVLLSPKHAGKLQIPPLQWGNEQSAAIELAVGGSGGSATQGGAQGNTQAANDNAHVYLTTSLDQKQPYVQAAVVLTVCLYADQALYQASLDFPASSDVLVKPLGKDVQTNETRNGRNYQIIERKYLLFPQRSGKLSLNGPVLDAQVQDNNANDPFGNLFGRSPFGGIMNSTQPIRVHAKPVELNVLPRPASAGGGNWLPAQKVTLEETWRPDTSNQNMTTIHAGEPLTRHLQITALGLTGAQLPDPNAYMTVPEGIKAYPDQATIADNPQGSTVAGSREQNIALIANRPGRYELPAVRLIWWDTLHNEKREITLPAHTLNVLPAAVGTTTAMMPPANAEPSLLLNQSAQAGTLEQTNNVTNKQPWMWLSFVFALLWLGSTAAWWRARQRVQLVQPAKIAAEKKPATTRGGSEVKAIKRACNNNDPQAARQHLLAWAGTIWPDTHPVGLNELSRKFDDAKLVEALRQLDRACYTGSAWNGEMLAQSLPNSPAAAVATENKHKMPELYN